MLLTLGPFLSFFCAGTSIPLKSMMHIAFPPICAKFINMPPMSAEFINFLLFSFNLSFFGIIYVFLLPPIFATMHHDSHVLDAPASLIVLYLHCSHCPASLL